MPAMMALLQRLLGVVLVCGVCAQQYWRQPQKHPLTPTFQKPQQQSKVPPPAAPLHECVLEEAEKIQCGAPGITVDQCQDISCCFDGHLCYYGKAVTVQCTRDGQFVVVVAREATWPPLDVNSVSLLDPNEAFCGPVDGTSAFAIFQFPVTACGTTLKQNDEGYVVYENHMVSSYEVGIGPKGSITRDSHFELLFQCRYLGTTVEGLVLEVNPVPPPMSVAAAGPLRVELRLGKGQCVSKGCLDDVAAYSSFYSSSDYPISKVLREPVYVEVRLLGRSDPNIVLNLERCWATSNPNPQSVPQWDLLVDGCPYPDDRYLTTVIPLDGSSGLEYPTHYKRFVSRMFSFVNSDTYAPQKDTVFIHCATAVCYPSRENSCEQQCHRQRRAAAEEVPPSHRLLVSSGKVILLKSTSHQKR
ncbi:zona pellucida sperm-binding protein 4-like isoform X1 [Poecilia latipinna]|uniref:zona pellucida sperm-binding protein 4-like isoform X1 n=1 Tax=Poecilia latipinna TaxID=48699 RepID=UPI00072E1B1F|nr:PREDICTED: zona pellucida sperm-binding protein 4-like isoform X1 [Poecilia latipinna]